LNNDLEITQNSMSLLHIALQDGFLNDEVVIKVNDQGVFHQFQVKTRFQLGLATSFEINVPEGLINMNVILPQKNLEQTTVLEISAPAYLGISLTADGNISFHLSNDRFRYL
jgi:hypothetical protein